MKAFLSSTFNHRTRMSLYFFVDGMQSSVVRVVQTREKFSLPGVMHIPGTPNVCTPVKIRKTYRQTEHSFGFVFHDQNETSRITLVSDQSSMNSLTTFFKWPKTKSDPEEVWIKLSSKNR